MAPLRKIKIFTNICQTKSPPVNIFMIFYEKEQRHSDIMNEHSFTIRGNLMSQSAMRSKSDFEYPCSLMAKMLCKAQKSHKQ